VFKGGSLPKWSIRISEENPVVFSYAWGLGDPKDLLFNNIAEAYVLWEGIKIAREMRISKLLILGDSMMVTRAIIKGIEVENNLLNNILFCSTSLLVEFEEVSILHIKCELNTIVDQMAKLGSRLNAGEFVSNRVMGSLPIP
jgi:ribonuclease HI